MATILFGHHDSSDTATYHVVAMPSRSFGSSVLPADSNAGYGAFFGMAACRRVTARMVFICKFMSESCRGKTLSTGSAWK